MAPAAPADESAAHQALLDSLNLAGRPRPFRNAAWKPSSRRNKNVKQMVGEASRREASALATSANSGANTPRPGSHLDGSGNVTPNPGAAGSSSGAGGGGAGGGIGAATQGLDRLVLERNLQAAAAAAAARGAGNGNLDIAAAVAAAGGAGAGSMMGAPAVTYSNIESAPSLNPAGKRPYCDITGLPARYTDPKTRLRYHDREVFALIRQLPQGVPERYLEARAAHVVLK